MLCQRRKPEANIALKIDAWNYYVVSFPIGSMYMHIYLCVGKYTYQAHGSYGFWDAFRFNLQGAPMAVAAAWLQVQSPRRRPWGRRFCRCCNWVVNDGAMMWKKHEQMVRIWWLHGKKWWTYMVNSQETLGAELKTRCEYMWFDVIFQYQNVNQKNEIRNLKPQKLSAFVEHRSPCLKMFLHLFS